LHVYDINKKTNVERKKAFRYLICCRVVAYSIYLYLQYIFYFFSKYIRIFTHHLSNFSGRLFLAESFFMSQ
jgi:lipopolysaccharide assembly outer membrane protein LptD (OstA)